MSEINTTTAAARPLLHVVHGDPVAIAEGVFVIPDGRVPLVPNIGVIVGDRAALVVDSGLGPRSGAIAYKIARELAGDRPLFLTLTHFHPEHGFGAQAFGDATLLYNRAQQEELRQKGASYLGMFRGMGDAIAEQLEGVKFVEPHIVYDERADVDLGGRVVQLRAWGRGHTRGDQTIFLPRLIARQRQRAREQIYPRVMDGLTPVLTDKLDAVLIAGANRLTPFRSLKPPPGRPSPVALLRLIDKLEQIRFEVARPYQAFGFGTFGVMIDQVGEFVLCAFGNTRQVYFKAHTVGRYIGIAAGENILVVFDILVVFAIASFAPLFIHVTDDTRRRIGAELAAMTGLGS